MIQPNAKCVVNGKKVNEIARWLNQFIALKNEELDVVDANNTPAKRWFLTGAVPGGVGSAESGDRDNLGGTSGNRDQLNPAPAGGNAGGPIGGGDGGQGGNVNPPVNIDGGGGGGAAGGGGGGAAGGAGRVRTPAGSATAIGGRRSQPSDTGMVPEILPATEPTPAPEPTPDTSREPRISGPASPSGADGIPLTASGHIDLSRMTPEQKEKYGFTDEIPLTASGHIDLRRMTPEQRAKYGFNDNIPI